MERNYSELVIFNPKGFPKPYSFVSGTCFEIEQVLPNFYALKNLLHISYEVRIKCGCFSSIEEAIDYALDVLKPIYEAYYRNEWHVVYGCSEDTNTFQDWVKEHNFKY